MNTTQPIEDICKACLAGYQRGMAIGSGLSAGTIEEMVEAYVNEELAAAFRIGFEAGQDAQLPSAIRAVHTLLDAAGVPIPTDPIHTPANDPTGLAWRVHNLQGNLERAKFLLAAMATGDAATVVQALDDIDAGTDDSDTGAHPVTGGQAKPTAQRIQAFLDACYGEDVLAGCLKGLSEGRDKVITIRGLILDGYKDVAKKNFPLDGVLGDPSQN